MVASFIVSRRSFLSRTRRDTHDSIGDTKGPLGLNTVFEPAESAIADLVFVHGLGGGSRSTWSKGNDPSLYWPEQWLPKDDGFQDVRIHSFGYNSNLEEESILNIHDFATSLLRSLQDCPLIPRDANTPFILVGHSMGGLVIKRAFILSKQKDEFLEISRRIRTLFFLATPHRGAKLAQTLTKILNLSSGSRPFVADLHRNSVATQAINDEFPHHCTDLQLYSFYETLPTNFGVYKSLVVEKDLAIMGYPNERTSYLNANHRGVCKYDDSVDPNYRTVRNALASAISSFRGHAALLRRDIDNERRKMLYNFLGISGAPEDDFMAVDSVRMTGSCQWLTDNGSFQEWQDSSRAQLYWVSARPGTGKTILSGKIISHLRELGRDCSFYFFSHGDKSKSTISSFLLSIAWQLSCTHSEVFSVVVEACEDGQLNKADYRMVWRKLFLEGIFSIPFSEPQFWVVDALDECKGSSELVPILLKVLEMCWVNIFVTSRDRFESHRLLANSKSRVIPDEILPADSKHDIALYVESNMHLLPIVDDNVQQNMISTILDKSAGCFLWVNLVFRELTQVHTSAEICEVLQSVPSDMDNLYSRILDSMSQAPYGKSLAKAILLWVVCSVRPLTTDELYHALQIDLNDSIDSIERSVASSCGQLVYIDSHSRVQIIHQTAQDFLLNANISSEFSIDKRLGHTRLLLACLSYLTGKEMRGPFARRLTSSSSTKEHSQFASYACTCFFRHITHVSSSDDEVMLMLTKFLSSPNILVWIEYISRHSELDVFIQAGKILKDYLQRRHSHVSPLSKEISLLSDWSSDLVRLVTKFGKSLSATPSSIYTIIPPFCPAETALHKQFGAPPRGISVLGLSTNAWDDCLSTIIDPEEDFLTVACSQSHFAIGTFSGKITIFQQTTCQEVKVLRSSEPVRILRFGQKRKILISAGRKTVRVWDLASWTETYVFEISERCMSLSLAGDDQMLLCAFANNHLMIWDLVSGTLTDSVDWRQDFKGTAYDGMNPRSATFCVELGLLAALYRGEGIFLWDLEQDSIYGTYDMTIGAVTEGVGKLYAGPGPLCAAFCTAPNTTLLAVSYPEGYLVLFDTSEGSVKATRKTTSHRLSCSPDGRTLASDGPGAIIQLFEFETLKLLYRIHTVGYYVDELVFSGDSRYLLGLTRTQCVVWDPTVLMRQEIEDENSDTISISTDPVEMRQREIVNSTLITAIACHDEGEFLFCGKEDGSVWLYNTRLGLQEKDLYLHRRGASIVMLKFDHSSQTLTSVDRHTRILVHRFSGSLPDWKAEKALLDYETGVPVHQVLNNLGYTRLLVSSKSIDTLWTISPDANEVVDTITWENPRGSYKWVTLPSNPEQLVLILHNVLHIYEWQTLRRLTNSEGILLEADIHTDLAVHYVRPCFRGQLIATAFSEPYRIQSGLQLLFWDTSVLTNSAATLMPCPEYQCLENKVRCLIGNYEQRLLYLDTDDWVCSISPQGTTHTRHFFLPADWLTAAKNSMIEVTTKGDIVFVKWDEIAVIRRGIDFSNTASGKRPSLTGGSSFSLVRR